MFAVRFVLIGAVLLLSMSLHLRVSAQTTTFSYQGSMNTGGSPANGNFDFEFAAFDAVSGGTQIGSTLTRTNVAVANGVFNVTLDFGSIFGGAGNRFLEIRTRPAGGGAFTTLSPRQQLLSSPYSIRTISAAFADNAGSLNGQPASFYQDASNLNSGTVADARIGSTIARRNVSNTFSGQNLFTSNSNEFAGDGANITNINASNIAFGTLSDGFLSTNIPRLNAGLNTFTFGARTLQLRNDSGLVPGLNLTGTSGNLGILRLRNSLEIWPSDDLSRSSGLDLRNNAGAATVVFSGSNGTGAMSGGLVLDTGSANSGTVDVGSIRFGSGATGEGIASRRASGNNQFGLDLYTASQPRVAITNGGSVGIGTTTPQAKLDVVGDIRATMVTAPNLPAARFSRSSRVTTVLGQNGSVVLDSISMTLPSAGFLKITGNVRIVSNPSDSGDSNGVARLAIEDVTGGGFSQLDFTTGNTVVLQPLWLTWIGPINAGPRTIQLKLYNTASNSTDVRYGSSWLIIEFYSATIP